MPEHIRNMKNICNLLHEVKRRGGYAAADIDKMIDTAESIYHGMKENT